MALETIGNVVVLVGGVGGAKLALGLSHILPPERLTIIVNVADDMWHLGLRICPDSDTILYTLSGLVDKANGWGVAGDTIHMLEALKRYNGETWFRLGDRDLATHFMRTQMLNQGARLTEVTRYLATQLGVMHPILPVTDDPVATMVDTVEHGELEFQSYFVRYRWQPQVRTIRYQGIESAKITPEVEQAIAEADVILFAPSNPWLSIQPILGVRGMLEAILARHVPRVAVTPIIGGDAVKGPAAKIMRELNQEVSAQTVADFYGASINGFVNDVRNPEFQKSGLHTIQLDTLMQTDDHKRALAENILNWVVNWDAI